MVTSEQNIPVNVVARPRAGEVDLLPGNESSDFIVLDLDNKEQLRHHAPKNGWTHDDLEALTVPKSIWAGGCNFYLNDVWIGSTEI